MPDDRISELLAEIERLRAAALQAIRDTPRSSGILTCQRLASDSLAGAAVTTQWKEESLGDPAYWREVIQYLNWRWKGCCAYCGGPGAEQIDHVRPSSVGGGDAISNLVLCCVGCNKAKGTQSAAEFGHHDLPLRALGQSLRGWRKTVERERRNAAMMESIFPRTPDKDQPF